MQHNLYGADTTKLVAKLNYKNKLVFGYFLLTHIFRISTTEQALVDLFQKILLNEYVDSSYRRRICEQFTNTNRYGAGYKEYFFENIAALLETDFDNRYRVSQGVNEDRKLQRRILKEMDQCLKNVLYSASLTYKGYAFLAKGSEIVSVLHMLIDWQKFRYKNKADLTNENFFVILNDKEEMNLLETDPNVFYRLNLWHRDLGFNIADISLDRLILESQKYVSYLLLTLKKPNKEVFNFLQGV